MKFAVVFALVVVCVIALCEAVPTDTSTTTVQPTATASKDVKDAIQKAKDAKKAKKECMKPCPDVFDPVCAYEAGNDTVKPRTFGSECALDVHNCEMGTKLTVKNKGECPGAGGVRLS